MANRLWTREETIIALHTYCRIPFKDSSKSHPLVVEVARKIGRTPDALNMKIGNFGRLDTTLRNRGITGLGHGSKLDELIWREYYGDFERLAIESERFLKEIAMDDLMELPAGEYREAKVKQRINQDFFRSIVLSAYNNTCCITGIRSVNLLEACHIVGWVDDCAIRTNPHNGLCLTCTLHKAFDDLLMAITPDYKVVVSEELMASALPTGTGSKMLREINGIKITLPDRFLPSPELLDVQYQKYLNAR